MAAKISHEWLVPKREVYKFFKQLNATRLTFGVHAEDDGKHAQRDREQQKAVHSAFYGETAPIGNAELLEQTERGFVTAISRANGRPLIITVPPRPILAPTLMKEAKNSDLKADLEESLVLLSTEPLERKFRQIGEKLSVRKYIREQGWRNARTTAMVKHLERTLGNADMSDEQILTLVYSSSSAGVSRREVLEDSGDLLNSIKAKVTKNGL